MNGISVYDILVVAVLAALTIRGGMKGMALQIASLASLVLSWIVAARFSQVLAPKIGLDPPWNRVLAMILLFVGTGAAVWVVFRFLSSTISAIKLKEFDRQMGALIGFFKGVLLCLIITFFAISMEWSRDSVYQSKSGYYLSWMLEKGQAAVPEDVLQHVREKLQKYHLYEEDFPDEETEELLEDGNSFFGNKVSQLKSTVDTISTIGEIRDSITGNKSETNSSQGSVLGNVFGLNGTGGDTNNNSTTTTVRTAQNEGISIPSIPVSNPLAGNTVANTSVSEPETPGLRRFVRPFKSNTELEEGRGDENSRPIWNPKLWSNALQEGKESR